MNEEIKALIEKSESKYKTAKIDFDNYQYDDSISRAYYAVYHGISACLFSKSLVFSSHSQTIGAFNKEFINGGIFKKEFSRIIQALFEDRQSGDYDLYFKPDKDLALKHLKNAQLIIENIKDYLIKNGHLNGKE